MEEIRKHLEEVGTVEDIKEFFSPLTQKHHFVYKVGKRKLNDFDTMTKLKEIQEKILFNYPILHKINMDKDILEVNLKTE